MSRAGRVLEGLLFVGLSAAPGLGWLAGALAAGDGPVPSPGGPGRPASRSRRLSAGAVDLALAWGLALVPYLGWALAGAFLCLRDHPALGGRSPGKRLAGLSLAGPRTTADHVRRNLSLALPLAQVVLVPLEAILVAAGARRLGDRWAGTVVVADGP